MNGWITCMTPPPFPAVPAIKSSGRFSIFPSQSSITVSSSVHAGLAACGPIKRWRCWSWAWIYTYSDYGIIPFVVLNPPAPPWGRVPPTLTTIGSERQRHLSYPGEADAANGPRQHVGQHGRKWAGRGEVSIEVWAVPVGHLEHKKGLTWLTAKLTLHLWNNMAPTSIEPLDSFKTPLKVFI